MAKNRYGTKKKGKAAKGGKKRSKRRSAAKAAYAEKVRRYGKQKAHAMTFGKKHAPKKRGKKGKKGGHHRSGGARMTRSAAVTQRLFDMALLEIQAANRTTGQPPTQEELVAADYLSDTYADVQRGHRSGTLSDAEKLRLKFKEEKQKLVDKLASEKLRKARAEEAKRQRDLEEAAARREAENDLRDL